MSVDADRRASPATTAILLGALVALALGLRLPSFSGALWADELATNYVVHGFGTGGLFSILLHGREATPPIFFLLTWLVKGVDGAEGLRIVSMLAGLASIPLTYLVGVRTVGQLPAFVGAALVALSPFQIFYSTEARAYELLMFTCLVATFALLQALSTNRASWWVAYGLSVAVAMYTHYVAIFVLFALFAWAFFAHPDARGRLLLANFGAALLFAPWIPEFVDDSGKQAAKNIEMLHPLTLGHAKTDLARMWFGQPLLGLSELPGKPAMWLIAGGIAVGSVGLALRLAGRGTGGWPRPSTGVVLVVVLALATPVGLVLHNIVAPSIFTPRNLIGSWPGFALALGALAGAGPGLVRTVAICLLIAGVGIGAVRMIDGDNRRPDYDAAAAFIERTGNPRSPVVDLPQFTPGPQMPLEAAMAPNGAAAPPDRSIYELGFPTLPERLELTRRGESLYQAGTRAPVPPETIARQAARAAGDGTLFVVGPPANLDLLRAFPGSLATFLAALPPRFHEVESRRFPGPSVFAVGVHVLSGSPP
jgi:4-amino-4-deoxy-L-arabinose transferase-like glycosyltransferase